MGKGQPVLRENRPLFAIDLAGLFQCNRSDKGAHTHTLGSCCRANLPVLRFGVVRGSSFPYRSCQSTAPKDFLFPHHRILTRLRGLVCLQEEDFPIEMRQDLVQGVHGRCTTSVVAANRHILASSCAAKLSSALATGSPEGGRKRFRLVSKPPASIGRGKVPGVGWLRTDLQNLSRAPHLTGSGDSPSHQCISQMERVPLSMMWQRDSKQFVQFHSPLVFSR
jgi:hypothetical protein